MATRPVCRWLGSCLLILGLCLALIGCQPRPADSAVHLTLWHGINPPANRLVFERLVDQFNRQHPDIQVEARYIGQADQQLPKILAAVVGNAAPDLLWYAPTLTGQLVELQAIRPLEAWLETSGLLDTLEPALLSTMTWENHLWSVPMATNNVGLFYRPSLFQKAGISQLPRTWAELKTVAQRLTQDTNGDGRPDQQGLLLPLGQGEWTVFTWLPFGFSAGGELTTAGRPLVDNPGNLAALQFWADLVKSGAARLSQPERGYEQEDFLQGKVAMQLTGPWTLGYLDETGVDYGVMPIPQAGRPATVLGGENLFVCATTPARATAAQTFLAYVLSEDFQQTWATQTGYLPVNQAVRQSASYQTWLRERPAVAVFLDQMAAAQSRPLAPGYSRLSRALGRAIEATLLGGSPDEALRKAQLRLAP